MIRVAVADVSELCEKIASGSARWKKHDVRVPEAEMFPMLPASLDGSHVVESRRGSVRHRGGGAGDGEGAVRRHRLPRDRP
jgi:hypothetical protein